MGIYTTYTKIIEGLNKLLDFTSIMLMIAMLAITLYQVIMRNVFDNAPVWSEEASLIMMCWFVYMGVVIGLKEGTHIGITLLVSRLSGKLRFLLEVVVNLLILSLSVLFVYYGHALSVFVQNSSLPATGLSSSVFYLPILMSGMFMLLVVLGKIAEQLLHRRAQQ